ncbi:hypothetical protein [Pelagicoccus sp. SDUM812003]|uniref:hypothetical protein n=1 Tax=Pelagicoccus sp. SDUM812003 TaxID=3041267 RepID=UPI0028100C1E|nr:hypothetical protein [Pelagicoccus sp. SDUM812003]MDQ8201498.1 hypothetical protein [Pelagicoccus sp. SDUM812003]
MSKNITPNREGTDDSVACYYLPTTTISRLLSGDLTKTPAYSSEYIEVYRDLTLAAMPGLIESAVSAARKGRAKAEEAFENNTTFEEPLSLKPQEATSCFIADSELKSYLERYEASTSDRILAYLVIEILTFLAKKETRRKAARAYVDKIDLKDHLKFMVSEVVKTGIAKPFTVEGGNAQ